MTDQVSQDMGAAMAKLLEAELRQRADLGTDAAQVTSESTLEQNLPDNDSRLQQDVLRIVAQALRIAEDELSPTDKLSGFGVDSIAITEVMVQISRFFNISVAPTTFFEARHVDDLVAILSQRYAEAIAAHYQSAEASSAEIPSVTTSPSTKPAQARPGQGTSYTDDRMQSWLARHAAVALHTLPDIMPAPVTSDHAGVPHSEPSSGAAPVAIIAMDGVFPDSADVAALREHLYHGDDCIRDIPPDRWDWRAIYGDPQKGHLTDIKSGGFIPEHDGFDAAFFNISPREAELLDPQHRLFMECVWRLIEQGGYAPGSLAGKKVALFVGINLLDYVDMANQAGIMEAQQMTGLGHAFCPNRLSFMLDIHGPSEVVDTACSSSLVAIHRAVMSIRHEGCEMAIAGGSNLILSPKQHMLFSKVGMLAQDGRCKTFSSDADGYSRAEGVGAVLLKRLDLAERDGDPILGVIRGSVAHHGGGATSLTAPNPVAQAELIAETYRQAQVDPRSVTYIECHGTGTSLGDPVEVQGLKSAFDALYQEHDLAAAARTPVALGSIKSNIGHTETAAGVAGLIKIMLSMRDGTLYRTLHCAQPNPLLELENSPFYLLQQASSWQRPMIDGVTVPRRAGLSSFGAGGANVHLLVEEYQASQMQSVVSTGPFLIPLSAKDRNALRQMVGQLRPYVECEVLDDLAYTLQVGRDAMRVRLAFVVTDRTQLITAMDAWLAGKPASYHEGEVPRKRVQAGQAASPATSDLSQLAADWVRGGEVDWRQLHQGAQRRRLTLPGYAFQHQTYWLPLDETSDNQPVYPAEPAMPTLQPDAEGGFTLELNDSAFFLCDHKVGEDAILPGVAYLEFARAAAEQSGLRDIMLQKVTWIRPLQVTGQATLHIALTPATEADVWQVAISTRQPAGTTLHAQMRIRCHAAAGVRSVDIAALEGQVRHRFGADEVYAAFDHMGINYGPAHRVIERLVVTDGAQRTVLARLKLPDTLQATLHEFGLHPSLMDGALQAAVGLVLNADGAAPQQAALPFALDEVGIIGPCEPRMWARVSADGDMIDRPGRDNVRRMQVDLISDQGDVRVQMRGFSVRAAKQAAASVLQTSAQLHIPHWQAFAGSAREGERRRVFSLGNVADLVAFRATDAQTQIDDLSSGLPEPVAQHYVQYAQRLLQEMRRLVESGEPVCVQWVLSDAPDKAPFQGLFGLLRSVQAEYSRIRVQMILCPALPAERLAQRLREAASAASGACLRVSEQGLEIATWRSITPDRARSATPWRAGGVYLITGGAGGLGRLLTEHIVRAVPDAHLVITGRSAQNAAITTWLNGLNAPNVVYRAVDVTDEQAVGQLIRDLRQTHGRIHGVLHAAGILDDATLLNKTEMAPVLAPKVTGLIHLDRAIGNDPLDFLVLFSSISGVLGNRGQVDYAAANGFLDGYAEARESLRQAGLRQGRCYAIAWPVWREGGMQLDAAGESLMRRATGLEPLPTADGLAALEHILHMQHPRVLVTAGDPARIQPLLNPPAEVEVRSESETVAETGGIPSDRLRPPLLKTLLGLTAEQLKVSADDLDPAIELTEYGFDSIAFTQYTNALNEHFALDLTPVVFFEYPTLDSLADYFVRDHAPAVATKLGIRPARPAPRTVPESAAPVRPRQQPVASVVASLKQDMRPGAAPDIAIIGMSGQFPQAPDLDTYWHNLSEGKDCISEIPAQRWDWRDYWGDPLAEPGRCNVKWGGFIDDVDQFDASFFGISAPEARMMDPQQRLLLTQAWKVMEDAGYAPKQLSGSDTGVFVGIADAQYSRIIADAGMQLEGYSMTGLAPSLGPNRISYFYNLNGPSVAVETACSSALVAIHRAADAIRAGDCDAALAGGINLLFNPDSFVGFARAGMLSPGGKSRTFSADADGYARGEGVGLVFLKRLDQAQQDGDRILAVIRASAENHGGHASSLTAPNPNAQASLLRKAYARAGFDTRTLGYIEAHGTGTPLGDPIEVEALKSAFTDLNAASEARYGQMPAMQCGIGSVKTNIGHLELAAGVAGLIKVLLQMRHGVLCRSLHSERLNPYLQLEGSPFRVLQQRSAWPRCEDAAGQQLPYRAGVSSFGFGGSNAHVVLEEYIAPEPAPVAQAISHTPYLFVLSAKTETALQQTARQLRAAVATSKPHLADVAYTLQTAREPMACRLAFSAGTADELLARLEACEQAAQDPALHRGNLKDNRTAISILEGDAELKRAVIGLAARGRQDDLLTLWANGFNVDWHELYPERVPRRISLPGYPFAVTRFWPKTPQVPLEKTRQIPSPEVVPVAPEPVAAALEVSGRAEPELTLPIRSVAERALERLTEIAAEILEVGPDALDADTELGEFGFDSVNMTSFASRVNDELELLLSPADLFEFATLRRLATHLADQWPVEEEPVAVPPAVDQVVAEVTSEPEPEPEPVRSSPTAADDPVVIVGYSCRFPQAEDADAFWRNLQAGRDCITRIPAERWDWRDYDGDPRSAAYKTNIHWGGFIDGVFDFDPLFFGISPREAELMDPQQRLMMMHAWNAIENAGHTPTELAGQSVGLFVGTSSSGYRATPRDDASSFGHVATGASPSIGPNRVSYFLDLHGPSEPVETACSSSLVALHRAVQSIQAGECDMALVGGVNTIVTPEAHINFSKAGMLSPDGRCKTFSAEANGYVRGEGVGMLFLRRRSDAERDGDPIRAIVRGSAVNHGGRANSLTAPNTVAQADLLRSAYAGAGLDMADVSYIEAHGTGTELGDPVEINALKAALADTTRRPVRQNTCGLGSVKTNIGHLELAAGVAGVIKVLLQMERQTLAPSLHADPPNPYINLTDSPFYIVKEARPWNTGGPRIAGVSSFGFGGVNAHIILEHYVPQTPSVVPVPEQPLPFILSARNPAALQRRAQTLLDAISAGHYTPTDLTDLCYTLRVGRSPMAERLALIASSLDELREALAQFVRVGTSAHILTGRVDTKTTPPLPESPTTAAWAAYWVRGGDPAQMPQVGRRRLVLPTYPFPQQAYQTAQVTDTPVSRVPASTVVDASGLQRHLRADDFFVRDHQVRGTAILPGAMGLELARQALTPADAFRPVRLQNISWRQPLAVPSEGIAARIQIQAGEQGMTDMRLLTHADGETEHMRAAGTLLDAGAERPADLDLAMLRQHCAQTLDRDWLYATYESLGLAYGPAFRAVETLSVSKDQVLAHLVLPSTAQDPDLALHPSLLDAAFHAVLGLYHARTGSGGAALPVALDELIVYAPTTDQMWVHLLERRVGEGLRKIDLSLADAQGQVSVTVRGFTLRTLPTVPPTPIRKPETTVSSASADSDQVADYFRNLVARETGVPLAEIDLHAPLEDYGIDSQLIMTLSDRLQQDFGSLPTTLFFEHQTLAELTDYFTAQHATRLAQLLGTVPPVTQPRSVVASAQTGSAPAVDDGGYGAAPIAIIGLAGRYPGADSVEELWQVLAQGKDCISEIPPERWDHTALYDPTGKPRTINSKWGGFVADHACFDPHFFNISPREAEFLDPQERLFLQCAWETLEDAGYTRTGLAPAPAPLKGGNVGVFVGVMYEEYQLYGAERTLAGEPVSLSGSAASIANRVSYFCNFHGPSIALDSMCSSSVSAIHLACESLRAGSCEAALAGGVNLHLHPNKYRNLGQSNFLSSNGRCESFGQGGDGYVPGEGVGAVLLKPLQQAQQDGDHVYGVIRASALNHGGKTNGYTVPNPAAQAAVIRAGMARAGVAAQDVSYIEAHGTGTSLGDPIEIAALSQTYRHETDALGYCAIGSIKSNIGHCESAAGIAGVTKVLLQLKHRQLAPSLHSETLNPGIDFAATPFVVQRRLADWQTPLREGKPLPRLAGVSSFGAGGSNAHLILQEYTDQPARTCGVEQRLFPFSARSEQALQRMLRTFRAALDQYAEDDMAAMAYVLQEGREAFEERIAILADTKAGLVNSLDRWLAGTTDLANVYRGTARFTRVGDVQQLAARARAWVAGARIDWAVYRNEPAPYRLSLPTYPFEREPYWVPGVPLPTSTRHQPQLNQPRPPLLFTPVWQEQPAGDAAAGQIATRSVLILCELNNQTRVQIRAQTDAATDIIEYPRSDADIATAYTGHAAALLRTVTDVIRARSPGALVQLVVPLDREDGLFAGLSGLLRCARMEKSTLACQLIGIRGTLPDIGTRLAQDALVASTDWDIRYLDGRRSVRGWCERPSQPVAETPWQDDGVYLITGGAGGIGLALAEHIAHTARQATIWLTGRSALNDAKNQILQALPARVEYRQVDVTEAQAVNDLIEQIRARHGRLDTVFHAAGLTRDALLVRKSEQDLRAVLAPKVTGMINLDAAIGDLPLRQMVLFASVAGALGNPGQTDYATANAFLDEFAAYRNRQVASGRRCGHTLSIDWPYWRDGGMQLDDRSIDAMQRNTGVSALATDVALLALDNLMLMSDVEQALVLDGDHPRIRSMMQPVSSPVVSVPESVRPEAPVVDIAARRASALNTIRRCFAEVLRIEPDRLDEHKPVDLFGVDSVSALEILDALQAELGTLPQTLLFEYPSIAKLTDALLQSHPEAFACESGATEPEVIVPVDPLPLTEPVYPAVQGRSDQDIAVISVAGRYPGADNVEAFWELLRTGRDCITEIPEDRWALAYSPEKGKPGHSYCKWGGFIRDVDCFDAEFFGYTPREAALSDPQERLFLETSWHLLERAAHTRDRLRDQYEGRVGVFVGAMYQQYQAVPADADSRSLLMLSSYASIANKTSYFFDLQGPSVALDSMCSSGLQAVHQACQSLRAGECRLAIAGGVNLSIHPDKYVALSRSGLIGSHAESRSFAEGDGYLPAEGVGAVLLKPLDQALQDNDRVIAVLKGSAANHGGHSAGYAVPNAEAQARLIEENLRACQIDARHISYVEAAANGSSMGDAIELRALTKAFRAFTDEENFCPIGSVKANMGHAEAASGMAQLTKVLLQLEHQALAPSLSATESVQTQFAQTPFVAQTELTDWQAPVIDGRSVPRLACVSSFGAGGSNVHLIVQQPPAQASATSAEKSDTLYHFPVSAASRAQLQQIVAGLQTFIIDHPALPLAGLAYTLQSGREAMACAVDLYAADVSALSDQLERALAGEVAGDRPAGVSETVAWNGPPLVLPDYPFARERHWISPDTVQPVPDTEQVPTPTPLPDRVAVSDLILGVIAQEQGVAPASLDRDAGLRAQGVDSMVALRLTHLVREQTGVSLSHADLDVYDTPHKLADYVLSCMQEEAVVETEDEAIALPATGHQRSPLSENQIGLWITQRLHPQISHYNVPLAFRLQGLNWDAVEQARATLIQRYPLLNARVLEQDGEPYWQAEPDIPPMLTQQVPDGMEAMDFMRQRARQPFDLASETLARFEWVCTDAAEPERFLCIVVHHIAVDGVAMVVLAQALWQAYAAAAGEPVEPDPAVVAADYADFVAWERAWIASERGQRQRAYWLDRLSGELPVLDLCTTREKTQPVSRSLTATLPLALHTAARTRAVALSVSPAALYLSVWLILLYCYTSSTDLVVGVPTLRRPERRFEQTLGYCANILAVRNQITGQMTLTTLVRQVQTTLAEAIDHGEYPFAALARELGGTEQGRPPYQVSFAYQNFPRAPENTIKLPSGHVQYLSQLRQAGDSPLGLDLFEEPDGLVVVAAWDSTLLRSDQMQNMLAHFTALVSALTTVAAATPISALPMLSDAEQARLDGWSQGADPAPDGDWVPAAILRRARSRRYRTALICGDRTLRYGQLRTRANRLAHYLRQKGVQKGDKVAVLLGRDADSIICLLSVLSLGAVWVPMDPDAPDERLRTLSDDAGAAVVLSKGKLVRRLYAGRLNHSNILDLDWEQGAIRRCSSRDLRVSLAAEDPAYMVYTSGSTGMPKGVLISHGALAVHCHTIIDQYALQPKDKVLQFASHAVDTALEQILPTLMAGGRLVMRDDVLWSPDELYHTLQHHQITVADLPPSYLRETLLAWRDNPAMTTSVALRLCLLGGEILPPDIIPLWSASCLADARLINAYGPTEATITALTYAVNPAADTGAVPIGRPLPGGQAYILDADGNLLPEGVIGELCLGGERLALGYHDRPELTQERFRECPLAPGKTPQRLYRTGDLAAYLPGSDGLIAFHGRMDHQVKVRGYRVELGEIESALIACGVAEAVVVPQCRTEGTACLMAFIVRTESGPDELALRDALAARLPIHMLPQQIVFVDYFPLNAAGKVDRQRLLREYREDTGPTAQNDAPRDDIEQRLTQVWQTVLAYEEDDTPGIFADFAACGGHSLAAVRLLGEISREFAVSLTVEDTGRAPTIAEQAKLLRQRIGVSGAVRADLPDVPGDPLLVPLRVSPEQADQPPLFLIHPVSGTVGGYRDLVAGMDSVQSVYALRARGLEAGETVDTGGVESLARRYLAMIQSIQPDGPYHLAGWSFGGLVAFEMARQLRTRDQDVAWLGLLDSYTPQALKQLTQSVDETDLSPENAFVRDLLGMPDFELSETTEDIWQNIAALPQVQNRLPGIGVSQLSRLFAVFQANTSAMSAYTPRPTDVAVTLFHTMTDEQGGDISGWQSFATGGFTRHKVPGNHYSFLSVPHVTEWVNRMISGRSGGR